MADFEVPDADAAEQTSDSAELPEAPSRSIEAPEADSVEQHTPVRAAADNPRHDLPPEADEADVAEQDSAIDYDEDDYR